MERWISLVGLGVMVLLAWGMSENRRRLNVRLIVSGIVLQFVMAMLLLWTAPGQQVFEAARVAVAQVLDFSNTGAEFVFGSSFQDHFVAFSVLPTIIFVSSLTALLFTPGSCSNWSS
jgi:concentrative nucleoside transporter, CNT family